MLILQIICQVDCLGVMVLLSEIMPILVQCLSVFGQSQIVIKNQHPIFHIIIGPLLPD